MRAALLDTLPALHLCVIQQGARRLLLVSAVPKGSHVLWRQELSDSAGPATRGSSAATTSATSLGRTTERSSWVLLVDGVRPWQLPSKQSGFLAWRIDARAVCRAMSSLRAMRRCEFHTFERVRGNDTAAQQHQRSAAALVAVPVVCCMRFERSAPFSSGSGGLRDAAHPWTTCSASCQDALA